MKMSKEYKNFPADIRKAEEKDIPIVAALAKEIWEEHYSPLIGFPQVNYMLDKFQSPESIRRQIEEEGYQYFIISMNGIPAGYCAVKPEENKKIFLSKLYIKSASRKQGLSRLLLHEAVSPYPDCNVYLTVNKHNRSSIAAYEAMGFQITDSVVNEIGNGYVMDDYIMTWDRS